MKKTASLSHLTSNSALLAGQPRLSDCQHAGIGSDEIAWISEQIPCKPTGRRRFIQRQRKVDGQMESFLVPIKGKPGGQSELRRNSKPRRSDNAVKLAYFRRMDERAAQEAIAEALGLAQSRQQDADGEWTAQGAAYCHMTDSDAADTMFDNADDVVSNAFNDNDHEHDDADVFGLSSYPPVVHSIKRAPPKRSLPPRELPQGRSVRAAGSRIRAWRSF